MLAAVGLIGFRSSEYYSLMLRMWWGPKVFGVVGFKKPVGHGLGFRVWGLGVRV